MRNLLVITMLLAGSSISSAMAKQLVVNGTFEDQTAWTGDFETETGPSGGFPTLNTQPYFWAGENDFKEITQVYDLTSSEKEALAGGGTIEFEMAADLFGFDTQNDASTFEARFLEGPEGEVLGRVSLTSIEGDPGTWPSTLTAGTAPSFQSTIGELPAETRSIEFSLEASRAEGFSNDGYADNLTFEINAIPASEPTDPQSPASIKEFIPPQDGTDVAPDTKIGAVIDPGDNTIDAESIVLRLDGEIVQASVDSDGRIRISYQPPDPLTSASEHVVSLTFAVEGAESQSVEWMFQVQSDSQTPFVPLRFEEISVAQGALSLSWIGGRPGVRLQQKEHLSDEEWEDVPADTDSSAILEITNPTGFFRLLSPSEGRSFSTSLTGDGSGEGSFVLTGEHLTFDVRYKGLPQPSETVSLGIVGQPETMIQLDRFLPEDAGTSGQFSGSISLSPEALEAVNRANLQLNIGTANQPKGVIQGRPFPDQIDVSIADEIAPLVNARPVPVTFAVDPPIPEHELNIKVLRGKPGSDIQVDSASSIRFLNDVGEIAETLVTDEEGRWSGTMVADAAGQGLASLYVNAEPVEGGGEIPITNPNHNCCGGCCGSALALDGCCGDSQDVGTTGSVHPYSGERVLTESHLTIPGRGFNWTLSLTYRSQGEHLRSLGSGVAGSDWALSYADDRLFKDQGSIIHFSDTCRTDLFTPTADPDVWEAPMEYYQQLRRNGQGNYELRSANGMVKTYARFDDPHIGGRLIRQEDRNGNFMTFQYGPLASGGEYVLKSVIDTMGRKVEYRYWEAGQTSNQAAIGRLHQVEDFSGRTVAFFYDDEGNLSLVRSPAVTDTPNGNDFPNGKLTRYHYLTEDDIPQGIAGYARQRLLHNLVGITYPNEIANTSIPDDPGRLPLPQYDDELKRETISYGKDPNDPATFDRMISYKIGGTNDNGVRAGGTIHYDYELVKTSGAGVNQPYMHATITDRRGNVTEYLWSAYETLLKKTEKTGGFRQQEPESYVTEFEYNNDKELVNTVLPMGNVKDYTFDERNRDRFQQGNLTDRLRQPDSRGGDQTALRTRTVYEPIYQQVAAKTDPRGLDPDFTPPISDPSGRSKQERYTTRYFFDYQEGAESDVLPMLAEELGTTESRVEDRLDSAGIELGLGDLNGDGDTTPRIGGNVIRVEKPSPVLFSNSHQADVEADRLQDIATTYRYNKFGQKTSEIDPEGNTHVRIYYPETDPDGDGSTTPQRTDRPSLDSSTGGYLKARVRDVAAAQGRNSGTNPEPTGIRKTYGYDEVGDRRSVSRGPSSPIGPPPAKTSRRPEPTNTTPTGMFKFTPTRMDR